MSTELLANQQIIWDKQKYGETPPRCHLTSIDHGQLALLTGYAAHKAELVFGVLGADPNGSASEVADVFYVGDVNNEPDFQNLLANSDAIALDNEHVTPKPFQEYQGATRLLFPPHYLPLTQNKRDQHIFLENASVSTLPDNRLPLPEFINQINSYEDLRRAAANYNYHCVLQSGTQAYDGRANAFINGPASVEPAWQKLGRKGNLFLEKLVNFEKELAVQVVRGFDGSEVIMPIVESTHVDGQLFLAQSGNYFDEKTKFDSLNVAKAVSQVIPGVGLLTVELFKLRTEDLSPGKLSVLINEICIGRPHNSGHHSIDSLETSQFDQIVRLAQNLPLGNASFKKNNTCSAMVNLLGSGVAGSEIHGIDEVESKLGVKVYWYFKSGRKGRKLGHINYAGNDPQKGRDTLQQALEMLNQNNHDLFQYTPQIFSSYH